MTNGQGANYPQNTGGINKLNDLEECKCTFTTQGRCATDLLQFISVGQKLEIEALRKRIKTLEGMLDRACEMIDFYKDKVKAQK